MEKQGEAVLWEQISLGTSTAAFLKTAGSLVGIRTEIPESGACGAQTALTVPDPDEKRIVERPGTGHALSNCRLQSSSGSQSSKLLEVRGEFIDNRLSRLRFRFPEAERAGMMQQLAARFGPGDDIELSDEDILEARKLTVHYWRDGDDLWTVEAGTSGTVILTHQDLTQSKTLPAPAEASRKGEPVSLDDIGIGKLDLKAPLPTVDLPTDALTDPANADTSSTD